MLSVGVPGSEMETWQPEVYQGVSSRTAPVYDLAEGGVELEHDLTGSSEAESPEVTQGDVFL